MDEQRIREICKFKYCSGNTRTVVWPGITALKGENLNVSWHKIYFSAMSIFKRILA